MVNTHTRRYAIYGCIVTQLGDVTTEFIDVGSNNMMSVAQYVEDTFNYRCVGACGCGCVNEC